MQTGLISPSRERQEGLSLELNGVGRRDAGVYVCTATNGVGKPARAEITVEVKCELVYWNINFADELFKPSFVVRMHS